MFNAHGLGKTIKILVVHRQKMVIDQVKSVLQDNTVVVRYSDSGLDGLLTSRIESFDLIICGTDLPVITGFELVRSIRTNSLNSKVPVIFVADELNAKTQHLANALGVAAMMVTPDLSSKLPQFVTDQVKTEDDKTWDDLLINRFAN
jgi:PleD family two-component response regulator